MYKLNGQLLLAIVLLLLPILYIGSYLAFVVPSGVPQGEYYCRFEKHDKTIYASYRINTNTEFAEWFFWPLERLDRKLRPGSWHDQELILPGTWW